VAALDALVEAVHFLGGERRRGQQYFVAIGRRVLADCGARTPPTAAPPKTISLVWN